MEQVKVALHQSVLAGGAVDGDVGVVKFDDLAVAYEGEVVLVYLGSGVVGELHVPVLSFDIHDIYIVTFFVEKRIDALCRAHRDIVL